MPNPRLVVFMAVAYACVGALVSALAGCTADSDSELLSEMVDTPEEGTAIRGQIEPRVSGIGVIGVRNGVASAVDTTDDSGVYTLHDIPAGEYNLIASGAGFFTDTSARAVVATRGQETLAPLITMRELTAAATLRGQTVSDATGEALAGVHVTVECRTGVCSNITAVTDADGRFEVGIWPELGARVIFQMSGYKPAFIQVDAVPSGLTHVAAAARMTAAHE